MKNKFKNLNLLISFVLLLQLSACFESSVEEGALGTTGATTTNIATESKTADGTGDSAPVSSTTTSVTLTAATGKAWKDFTISLGSHFLAANICEGKTIFGRAGEAACQALIDNRYHTVGTPSVKRNFPVIATDTDGYQGASAITKATRPSNDCGTTGSVEDRIADCALTAKNGTNATWNGSTLSNTAHGTWKLVSRQGANKEVWRDERTKLIWSAKIVTADLISSATVGTTWCQAAGNNEATNGYCNSATYQPNTTTPRSICAEGTEGSITRTEALRGENWSAGTYHVTKGGLGAHSSAGSVSWRLPTREDYFIAYANGMGYVLPEYLATYFWTSSVYSGSSYVAWYFNARSEGYVEVNVYGRNTATGVRCVGL